MSGVQPRIWALLGHRKGDNLQVLALARSLGLPFETRTLRYNLLRKLKKAWLGARLDNVVPSARQWLQPPWPDLVIAIGHRSVPAARFIRRMSGGKTRLVQLGNPRLDPSSFDLVITMPQYAVPEAGNVLRLPFAMGAQHPRQRTTDEERAILDSLARPHILLALGGATRNWLMPPDEMAQIARALVERAEQQGGTLIAVGSPRTGPQVLAAVHQALAGGRHLMVAGSMPRYGALLRDADEIHVTSDSISMLSEAVFSGRPVGLIPLPLSRRGRWHYRLSDLGILKPPARDLRRVRNRLVEDKMVGTLEAPLAGNAADPIEIASAAVLKLLTIPSRQNPRP